MGKNLDTPSAPGFGIGAPAPGSDPEDSGDDDLEPKDAARPDNLGTYSSSHISSNIQRHYTQEDADSLVGGQDITLGDEEDDRSKTNRSPGTEFFGQKVFSFSLPFGGLSSIRSNFKLPFVHKDEDPEIEQLRLRLERQQSVTTVDEARYFSAQKGTDDVRMRAMKHSIKENISDFLPEFISKKDKPYETVYNEISGPVVVLGGYRGSILRETASGKRAWIPLKAGLNLRKIRLLLGPSPEDELRATDLIYPDGILKNIGPFDICKKFLKKLDNGKTTVREFGYDWRLSLAITSAQLVTFLEKLYKEKGEKAIVVAHSMGGLVAHAAMQQRPDLFRGLVYVGVPSECLNILGPIRYGDSVMFSDRILTFETNFMMRSSYAFLPLTGRVFANKETGEWYDLDYFDPETWVKYNLNPLVSSVRKAHEEESGSETPSLDTLVSDKSEKLEKDKSEKPDKSEKLEKPEKLSRHSPSDLTPSSPTSPSPIGALSSRIKSFQTGINRISKPSMLTNSQMIKRHKSGRLSPVSHDDEEFEYSFSFKDAYDYLCDTLAKTKKFVLGLEFDSTLKTKYPPLAVVYGDTVPSVRGSYVTSPQDIRDGNYYHFFYGRGDGVVNSRWLMPENKGFDRYDAKKKTGHIVGKFASRAGHVNLMTDFEAMANALGAIIDAEKNWY